MTIRDIALSLGVSEKTIRKKISQMEIPKDASGRFIITKEDYIKLLYNYYPSMYAKVSHTVVPLIRKESKRMNRGKIQKVTRKDKTVYYIRQFPIGYDENGKVIYAKTNKGYSSRELAELARCELERLRDIKKTDINGTYVDYCINFVNNQELAEGTKATRLTAINTQFKPYFKNTLVTELTPQLVKAFSEKVKVSVSNTRVVLRQTLKNLFTDQIITTDLTQFFMFPKCEQREKKKPLKREQIEAFFKYVKGHMWEHIIHLLYKSGIRVGEALALQWNEVELLQDDLILLHINSTLGKVGGRQIGRKDPKTLSSKRTVVIYDSVLWKLLKRQSEISRSKWVCENIHGFAPINYNFLLRKLINPAKEALGFDVSPHVARHTFISHCLAKGIQAEDIAGQVGHTNTEMIYKVYGKAVEDPKEIYKSFRIL